MHWNWGKLVAYDSFSFYLEDHLHMSHWIHICLLFSPNILTFRWRTFDSYFMSICIRGIVFHFYSISFWGYRIFGIFCICFHLMDIDFIFILVGFNFTWLIWYSFKVWFFCFYRFFFINRILLLFLWIVWCMLYHYNVCTLY